MRQILKNNTAARFGIVGALNTAIDFGALLLLTLIGLPALAANIASTSLAFSFSFFANKHYTFQSNSGNVRRQLILFVAITLFGLWGLQSIVIALVNPWLSGFLDASVALIAAKVLATVVSLVWNYVMYSRVVFTKQP